MVQARRPFGEYSPQRNKFNLGFNDYYPTWGTYDQWRARLPQYEEYRQSSRIPLKSSTNIFTDIVLPKLAAAAITHGARVGLKGGKLGKAPNPNSTELGEAEVVENFVKSIIDKMGTNKTRYGESPIPSNAEVFKTAEEQHNKRVTAAREAEAKRLEEERIKKMLEDENAEKQKGEKFKPRPHAPVRDSDINRRPGLVEPLPYVPPKPTKPTKPPKPPPTRPDYPPGNFTGERAKKPPKQPTGGRGGASSGERDIPPAYQDPSPPLEEPPGHRPGGEGHYNLPTPTEPSGNKPQHDKANTLSSWDKRAKSTRAKAMNTLLWRRRRGGG